VASSWSESSLGLSIGMAFRVGGSIPRVKRSRSARFRIQRPGGALQRTRGEIHGVI